MEGFWQGLTLEAWLKVDRIRTLTCPEGLTVSLSFCLQPESRVQTAAAGVRAGQAFRRLLPLFDRVLVERSAAETVTKGGIMLPEKSRKKYCKQWW